MEHFGAASGGARQKSFLLVSHQPLVVVCSHFARHVLLDPAVQPGLEAPVQTRVHLLVRLKHQTREMSNAAQAVQSLKLEKNIFFNLLL